MGSTTVYQSVDTLYNAPGASQERVWSIDGLIDHNAEKYGVSAVLMRSIMSCENRDRDTNLQSYHPDPTGPNGREDSWGLVQIHLPSWPDITREQATDPEFAIDFLAKKLSENKGYLWTCYRTLK